MADAPDPRRSSEFAGFTPTQLQYLPLLLEQWNGLSSEAREMWTDLYVWDIRHKREHEAEAEQKVINDRKAVESAKDKEAARDRKSNRRINVALGVGTLLVGIASYVGTHVNQPDVPTQRIVVCSQLSPGSNTCVPLPTAVPSPAPTIAGQEP